MIETIRKKLAEIEQEMDVTILYACESGSRAWGFPSKDSDYDVRFIYLNKLEWYLSIFESRDVIEKEEGRLDFSGWDFKKALRLFKKSNPAIMEWLGSPIVYIDRFGVADKLRSIMGQYYSQTSCSYHYVHMAKGNFKDYLKADSVWIKKYFYVLRPLLAVKWIEQGRGVVPTDFTELLKEIEIDNFLKEEIWELIELKKAGTELGYGPKNHVISKFIEHELDTQLKKDHIYPSPGAPIDILNDLFIKTLDMESEAWDQEKLP